MGFLDRLVGDMLQESTGLPVKRLVRKVGGGKLLLAGAGALLAGGLVDKLSQGQGGARPAPPPGAAPPPPPGAAPPPPPKPTGGAPAVMPPPPPPPSAATDEDELPRELTYAIVRTMAAAALADGDLTPEERRVIQNRLGESGLSAEQVRQIDHDLVKPPTPEDLAELVPGAEAREVLYRFAALIVLADRETSGTEREWLERLASAFEIPEDRKEALEAELFADEDTEPADTESTEAAS